MPILLADVGGTNIRFSILENDKISEIEYYKTSDFKNIETALESYLQKVNKQPQKMVLGVAGLIQNGIAQLTNADFKISQPQLESIYPKTKIILVNDFILQGYGILKTNEKDLYLLNGTNTPQIGNKIVLGPGTGLGSCFLIPNATGFTVLSSESGHTTLAPITPNQQKILAEISKEEMPLSFEDIISGSGLCRLYQAILKIQQFAPDSSWLNELEEMKTAFSIRSLKEASFMPLRPKEITLLAEQEDEIALLTFWYFFEFLGIYASNLALTIKSEGGVYLVGNLLNQSTIRSLLIKSNFKKFFHMKQIFASYLKNIPVYLVEKPDIQIQGLIYLAKTL